jgi:hypothetical protein
MSNKNLRLAGWSALLAAVLMVVAMVSFPLGAGMLGGVFEITALLLTIVVFYGLFIILRSESTSLGLTGLVFAGLAVAVDVVSMLSYGNTFFASLWYLLFSLPFLIYCFLTFKSTKMPRVLALGTLLIGGLLFVGGVAGFLGSQAVADNVTIIPFLLILVWLVWLWRLFLSERMAPAAA